MGASGNIGRRTDQALMASPKGRLAVLVLVTLAKTYSLASREVFRARARSAHRADQDRNYRAEIAPPSGSSRSKRISLDRAEALPHRDLKALVLSAKRGDSKAQAGRLRCHQKILPAQRLSPRPERSWWQRRPR